MAWDFQSSGVVLLFCLLSSSVSVKIVHVKMCTPRDIGKALGLSQSSANPKALNPKP